MHTVTQELKNRFVGLTLLNEIINFQTYFDVVPQSGDDLLLIGYLQNLEVKGLLRIENSKFVPTNEGRNEVVNMYAKYYEYLKIFDIYCAVDLAKGEFAFESRNNDFSEEDWKAFVDQERFSDIRVAIAEIKGIDPIEIVFMSFLNEGRFECTGSDWQYNLTEDNVWKEIEEICNTAIRGSYLEEQGVVEDITKKATEISIQIIKDSESFDSDESDEEEVIETTTYVDIVEMPVYEDYYWDSYYDPYYVSPLWLAIILL
jgi:hypothetical protein